jgi:hypothetical protein
VTVKAGETKEVTFTATATADANVGAAKVAIVDQTYKAADATGTTKVDGATVAVVTTPTTGATTLIFTAAANNPN